MNAPFRDPGSNGAFDWYPGRLWSLWDVLKFDAAAFYQVTSSLRHIRTMLHERGEDKYSENADGSINATLMDDPFVLETMRNHANELQASLLALGTRQTS